MYRRKSFVSDSDGFLRLHAMLDFSSYCLSYLFTNHDFGEGTLGVAYVGGVCARYGKIRDERTGVTDRRSINTGFITVQDPMTADGVLVRVNP